MTHFLLFPLRRVTSTRETITTTTTTGPNRVIALHIIYHDISLFSSQKSDKHKGDHHHHHHHRSKQEVEEVEDAGDDDAPKQCLGPGCVNHARQASKYCSDECGMKLAKR